MPKVGSSGPPIDRGLSVEDELYDVLQMVMESLGRRVPVEHNPTALIYAASLWCRERSGLAPARADLDDDLPF